MISNRRSKSSKTQINQVVAALLEPYRETIISIDIQSSTAAIATLAIPLCFRKIIDLGFK
jgi:heat shock protein HspQ